MRTLLLSRAQQKDLISGHLPEVLATNPFTAPTGEKQGERECLGFDADDVIIEAGPRQQEEDTEEESPPLTNR